MARNAQLMLVLEAGTCDVCSEMGTVAWFGKHDSRGAVRRMSRLCVECIVRAAEAMTGFRFVNQYENWCILRERTAIIKARKSTERNS